MGKSPLNDRPNHCRARVRMSDQAPRWTGPAMDRAPRGAADRAPRRRRLPSMAGFPVPREQLAHEIDDGPDPRAGAQAAMHRQPDILVERGDVRNCGDQIVCFAGQESGQHAETGAMGNAVENPQAVTAAHPWRRCAGQCPQPAIGLELGTRLVEPHERHAGPVLIRQRDRMARCHGAAAVQAERERTDLAGDEVELLGAIRPDRDIGLAPRQVVEIGRASCRERVF